MAESELKKKAKLIHVPTDDAEINQMFRSVGEPICLYGEQKLDRIERLKKLLATIGDIKQYQQQKEEATKLKELDVMPSFPFLFCDFDNVIIMHCCFHFSLYRNKHGITLVQIH